MRYHLAVRVEPDDGSQAYVFLLRDRSLRVTADDRK